MAVLLWHAGLAGTEVLAHDAPRAAVVAIAAVCARLAGSAAQRYRLLLLAKGVGFDAYQVRPRLIARVVGGFVLAHTAGGAFVGNASYLNTARQDHGGDGCRKDRCHRSRHRSAVSLHGFRPTRGRPRHFVGKLRKAD